MLSKSPIALLGTTINRCRRANRLFFSMTLRWTSPPRSISCRSSHAPMTYLNNQAAHPPHKVEDFARELIRGHFGYLARQRGKVTLVTDFERLKIDLLGQIVERRDLFFGIPWPTR